MSEQDDDKFGMYGSKKAAAKWDWDQVVRGLGLVSIQFQSLESLIKIGIGELVAKDDPIMGMLITAELPFKGLIDLLYVAWEHSSKDRETSEELAKILKRCGNAARRRNELVHSYWSQETKDGKTVAIRVKFTARLRQGLRMKNETITAAIMEKVAQELRDCRLDLYELLASKLPGLNPTKT
jgi:hypothetical protein